MNSSLNQQSYFLNLARDINSLQCGEINRDEKLVVEEKKVVLSPLQGLKWVFVPSGQNRVSATGFSRSLRELTPNFVDRRAIQPNGGQTESVWLKRTESGLRFFRPRTIAI
jgi:hypothetical protein